MDRQGGATPNPFMQEALKLEALQGFTSGHLATVGRRALGGSYDLQNDKMFLKEFESRFSGGDQLWKCLRLRDLWCSLDRVDLVAQTSH